MKLPAALLSLLVLLLPAAHAQPEGEAGPAALVASGCAGPPCGYITPIVDLEFAGKAKCSGAPGSIDLSKCIPLPPKDGSVSFDGTFRYYWKLSEDLTYPPGNEPVVVSFSGVSTNPKWLTFKIEPATITIDSVALLSPANMRVDDANPASPVVYYDFRSDLKITFTRSGDPTPADLDRILSKGGITDVFVKAKSSASGAYFKEGFGVETFRFATDSVLPAEPAPDAKTLPAGVLAPLAGLTVAVLARRRF